TALGLSVVSPWNDSGVSATTFKIGTGLFLVVIAMISSALGGHVAGRLRSGWDQTVHSNEVYFRDTAQGFVAWSLATVIGAILLASVATGIAGTTAGGLASGATNAATSRSSGPADIYVDQLLRPTASATGASATANGVGDNRAELSRLLTASWRS